MLGTGERRGTAIARIVESLASTIATDRYSISILFIGREGTLGARFRGVGLPVSSARWSGGWQGPAGAFRFARYIRDSGARILHLHAGGRAPALIARAVSSAHVVAHYHSLGAGTRGRGLKRTTSAELVIANSAATAATIRAKNVIIVHPGVVVSPRARVRRGGEGPVIAGIAGGLEHVKGIDILLDAALMLKQQGCRIVFEIAGEGPDMELLQRKCVDNGLQGVVRFAGWSDNIRSLMENWQIYIQPSRREGFGLAILEAMATGLPVVASNVGGIPELVTNNVTGFLVPPDDARALSKAIARLAGDLALREAMGDASRGAATRFTPERAATSVCLAYDRLLSV